MPLKRAVFLDRDGTVIREKEYLARPDQVELLPGAGSALRRLANAGLMLILVTNQSGVGRGYFTIDDVHAVHRYLMELLRPDGVAFLKIYIAPEAPDQPSEGRKPSPQFLFDARDEFGVDLSLSYMVGDKLIDLECGWNAGVRRSLLVRTGYGRGVIEQESEALARGQAVAVDDVAAAAAWILKDMES